MTYLGFLAKEAGIRRQVPSTRLPERDVSIAASDEAARPIVGTADEARKQHLERAAGKTRTGNDTELNDGTGRCHMTALLLQHDFHPHHMPLHHSLRTARCVLGHDATSVASFHSPELDRHTAMVW